MLPTSLEASTSALLPRLPPTLLATDLARIQVVQADKERYSQLKPPSSALSLPSAVLISSATRLVFA